MQFLSLLLKAEHAQLRDFQGLYSSELDDSLESSLAWLLKSSDEIYSISFQVSSDVNHCDALN